MERKVRYLCPICFEDSGIDLIKYPEIKFNRGEHYNSPHYDKFETIVDPWIYFRAKCNKCDNFVEFIDIDDGFVDIIKFLNENGYETKLCCEGHYRSDTDFDSPYLIFECSWGEYEIFKTVQHIPNYWKMYTKKIFFDNDGVYETTRVELYCRDYLKYKDTAMDDLREFIKYFPVPEE